MGPLLVIERFTSLNRDVSQRFRRTGCADPTRARGGGQVDARGQRPGPARIRLGVAGCPLPRRSLGRDREAVFVDRSDLASATAIFKEERCEFPRASLVSLNKLEPFRMPPQPGTFPAIFRSEDQDAISFIMRRYGSVRLAETLAQFNAPGRAIMKDGLYDDGLVRTHRFVATRDYKIGKTAQASALRQLHEEASDIADILAKTDAAAKAMDAAHQALGDLAATTPDADLSALCARLSALVGGQSRGRGQDGSLGQRWRRRPA